MLQGIRKSKFALVLQDGAFDVEDFLTSAALGACEYVSPNAALVPFLGTARNASGESLPIEQLVVVGAHYDFWTHRPAIMSGGKLMAGTAIPELLVRLDTTLGPRWVLFEAKLHSNKSSVASASGEVTDQLAKYWLHLVQAAGAEAEALAVVYVTRHPVLPVADLQASAKELLDKGFGTPRIYWTHWRRLTAIAAHAADGNPLLRDVAQILRENFGLRPIADSWDWGHAVAPGKAWRFGWDWAAYSDAIPVGQWEFKQ
jgi:hypothetical protein